MAGLTTGWIPDPEEICCLRTQVSIGVSWEVENSRTAAPLTRFIVGGTGMALNGNVPFSAASRHELYLPMYPFVFNCHLAPQLSWEVLKLQFMFRIVKASSVWFFRIAHCHDNTSQLPLHPSNSKRTLHLNHWTKCGISPLWLQDVPFLSVAWIIISTNCINEIFVNVWGELTARMLMLWFTSDCGTLDRSENSCLGVWQSQLLY